MHVFIFSSFLHAVFFQVITQISRRVSLLCLFSFFGFCTEPAELLGEEQENHGSKLQHQDVRRAVEFRNCFHMMIQRVFSGKQ